MTPLPITSEPATRAVNEIGIKYLEDLAKYTEKELLKLHGVGPKAIRIWKEHLKAKGLDFRK